MPPLQSFAERADAHLPRIRLRFTALYAATLLVVLLSAATALRFAPCGPPWSANSANR